MYGHIIQLIYVKHEQFTDAMLKESFRIKSAFQRRHNLLRTIE